MELTREQLSEILRQEYLKAISGPPFHIKMWDKVADGVIERIRELTESPSVTTGD